MKKALVRVIFLFAVGFPSIALGAGFATQSIFLSKSPVVEGDTVRVHATVSNDATSTFTGTVVIKDGTDSIGSIAVTLAAGAAQAISTSWSPLAGAHTLTAELQTPSGMVIQKTSADFTVAEKPRPVAATPQSGSSQLSASVESSAPIQQDIASYSPQAASLSAPVFSTLDSFRSSADSFIDSQLASMKARLGSTPQPLPTLINPTASPTLPTTANGFWFILYTIYFYALTIASFIISNVAVFYPLVVIVFFYILWRLFRRVRRPRY